MQQVDDQVDRLDTDEGNDQPAKPRKKQVWTDPDGFPELMAGDWWNDAMGAGAVLRKVPSARGKDAPQTSGKDER